MSPPPGSTLGSYSDMFRELGLLRDHLRVGFGDFSSSFKMVVIRMLCAGCRDVVIRSFRVDQSH